MIGRTDVEREDGAIRSRHRIAGTLDDFQPVEEKGVPGGYASLDGGGDVPLDQLPTHASTHNHGGSDVLAEDAAAGTPSLRSLGTTSTKAAAGDDARFTDARTPTAHNTSHRAGGSDPFFISGSTVCNDAAWTTIIATGHARGGYIVFLYLNNVGDVADYGAYGVFVADGSASRMLHNVNGVLMNIQVDGSGNIQAQQSSGGSASVQWDYYRIRG